jgi:hypothetical protein
MAAVALFQLGASLNMLEMSVCLFIIIAFTMILEILIESINEQLEEWDNEHLKTLFNKVLAELMIMGTISFGIFLGEQIFALAKRSFYLELEFAHLFVFMVAISFVIQAAMLIKMMNSVVHWWHQISAGGLPYCVRACEAELNKIQHHKSASMFNLWAKFKKSLLQERCSFFIVRFYFLSHNRLPMNFNFVSYLDKSTIVWIVETVHIDSFYWACVCICIWVNWLRSFVIDVAMNDPFPGGYEAGFSNHTLSNGTVITREHYSLDRSARAQYPVIGYA